MNDDFNEDDIYCDNEINICDPTDCYFSNNFDVSGCKMLCVILLW